MIDASREDDTRRGKSRRELVSRGDAHRRVARWFFNEAHATGFSREGALSGS